MAQKQTQLIDITTLSAETFAWSDVFSSFTPDQRVYVYPDETLAGNTNIVEYENGIQIRQYSGVADGAGIITIASAGISNGDTFDTNTGIYTFADGQANRFQTPTLQPADVSDPNLRIEDGVFVIIDEEGKTHRVSKALNFKGDPNQIDITTAEDGTVTVTLAEQIAFDTIEAQSGIIHNNLSVGKNVSAKAYILDGYTQSEVDTGIAPRNSLCRII